MFLADNRIKFSETCVVRNLYLFDYANDYFCLMDPVQIGFTVVHPHLEISVPISNYCIKAVLVQTYDLVDIT